MPEAKEPKTLRQVMHAGRKADAQAGFATNERRYEAAAKNRLTHQHWSGVPGNPINADIFSSLETIRQRCEYEAANNPTLAGIIETKATDIFGHHGPALNLVSDTDPEFARAAEKKWKAFWKNPDANGEMAGVDKGRLWVHTRFTSGEFLEQIVARNDGPTKFAIRSIHPRRLANGREHVGKPNVVMGVERNDAGKVTQYHIVKEKQMGSQSFAIGETQTVPSRDMIHQFKRVEADQARGVPDIAPALLIIGDLRDFEAAVLDAQRSAADHSTLLYTEMPGADFQDITGGSTYTFERQTTTALPAGWKAEQIKPGQPTAQYKDYRHERWAEIGRVVPMPLMMILLASRGWNYSSARFDAQIYMRAIRSEQAWFERGVLNRLLDLVLSEVALERGLVEIPEDLATAWIWPALPHVDPLKESAGDDIRLKNLTKTYSMAAAELGLTVEELVAQHKRDRQAFMDAGIDLVLAATSKETVDLIEMVENLNGGEETTEGMDDGPAKPAQTA